MSVVLTFTSNHHFSQSKIALRGRTGKWNCFPLKQIFRITFNVFHVIWCYSAFNSFYLRLRAAVFFTGTTPCMKIINILWVAFFYLSVTCSFSLLVFYFVFFGKRKLTKKLLVNCWWNWLLLELHYWDLAKTFWGSGFKSHQNQY